MRRLAEISAFLGLSAVVHAGVMAGLGGAPGAPEGQGAGGADRISLQAAPESLAALAERWTSPPEAAVQPAPMAVPVLTEAPPPVAAATAPLPMAQAAPPVAPTQDHPPMAEAPAPALSRPTVPITPNAMPAPTPEPVAAPRPRMDTTPLRQTAPRLAAPERAAQPTPDSATPPAPHATELATGSSPRPAPRPVDQRPAPAPQASPASTPQPARVARGGGDGATQGAAARPPQTPAGPNAAQRQSLMAHWGGQIMARIERSRPRVRGTGQVGVTLRLSPDGQLSGLSVARSSGDPALDAAALSAVRGVGRFPAAPDGLTEASYSFSVPIRFR